MSRDAMSDLLEQRSDAARRRLPAWAARVATVVLVVITGVLVGSHVLSGQPPQPERRHITDGDQVREHLQPLPPAVIARSNSDVLRFGTRGSSRVVRLPRGFAQDERLWAVDDAGYPALLYGVRGRDLFRIEAATGRLVRNLGDVVRIVDVGPGSGELVVQVVTGSGSKVVLIEAASGDVIDLQPFPGFTGADGWIPRAVISALGVPGVLLLRPVAHGGNEVAIAWSELGVAAGLMPTRLQRLGQAGRLLGVAEDLVLFLSADCPSPTCVLTILDFPREGPRRRSVRAPDSWSFTPGMIGGSSHEVLVPVVAAARDRPHALARVVPRADTAMLLQKSVGLVATAGMIVEPDGSVYFLRAEEEQGAQAVLARWSPVDLPPIVSFPELPRLPAGARLVCVCD